MASHTVDQKVAQPLPPMYWLGLILVYLFIPLILFLCGWDFGWWQAWGFTVLIVAVGVGSRAWGESRHPGMMVERLKFGQDADAKPWDKVLSPLMSISISFPLVIVAGLDHRFGWSPGFSTWLNILGLILAATGYAFASWAMAENRFFSSVVQIQLERGHVVCDRGPYRIVRHPGYAGNILALPGIALALSSVWISSPRRLRSSSLSSAQLWKTGRFRKSYLATGTIPGACPIGFSQVPTNRS